MKLKKIYSLMLSLAILPTALITTSASAANDYSVATTNTRVQTSPYLAQDPGWTFAVTPYAWLLNMNGRVGVASRAAHLDQDFSEIFQKMNFGGMLWLEANKDRFGIFLNALYADLSDDVSDGPVSLDATNHYGLFSGGVSYNVYQHCFGYACDGSRQKLDVEPYLGFRYTLNDTTVRLSGFGLSLSDSNNQKWVDPIAGARLRFTMTNAWSVIFAGDVGGTNRSSDYSYNAMALIGYSPQSMWANTTAYLGYRLLYQHYDTGSGSDKFVWDMKLFGPMLGFAIKF